MGNGLCYEHKRKEQEEEQIPGEGKTNFQFSKMLAIMRIRTEYLNRFFGVRFPFFRRICFPYFIFT